MTCLGAVAPHGARAQLVKSDFAAPGDGLLVTDEATGLEWLSPLYTKGRSYNDVLGDYAGLLSTHGFEIAEQSAVRSMIASNFDNPTSTYSPDNYARALSFFDVFGIAANMSCPYASPPGPCPRTQAFAVNGASLTQLGMITLGGTHGALIDHTYPAEEWVANIRDSQRGVWLVRSTQQDEDGDGVVDDDDLCPGTLAGTVDASGCADAQVDQDGDGICDDGAPSGGPAGCVGSDNCPTVPNPLQEQTGNNVGGAFGDACVDPTATIPADSSVAPDAVLGSDTQLNTGVTVESGAQLGDSVTVNRDTAIGQDTVVGAGTSLNRNVAIGSDTVIGSNVTIGRDVFIGSSVVIGDNTVINQGAVIEDGVTIGADVTIGKGATIEATATVADGTVVPKDAVVTP
jgi:acetyltransferase-like isoleucine patch superfamily enzyme